MFYPQNEEYVCTTEMVVAIAETHGKKIKLIKLFNYLISVLKLSTVKKVFGSLVYDKSISEYKDKYCIYDFKTSILLTERDSNQQ